MYFLSWVRFQFLFARLFVCLSVYFFSLCNRKWKSFWFVRFTCLFFFFLSASYSFILIYLQHFRIFRTHIGVIVFCHSFIYFFFSFIFQKYSLQNYPYNVILYWLFVTASIETFPLRSFSPLPFVCLFVDWFLLLYIFFLFISTSLARTRLYKISFAKFWQITNCRYKTALRLVWHQEQKKKRKRKIYRI